MCMYLGVEANMDLQCHLRSLNYTIVQTEGVFRHMTTTLLKDLTPCHKGKGYFKRTRSGDTRCEVHR